MNFEINTMLSVEIHFLELELIMLSSSTIGLRMDKGYYLIYWAVLLSGMAYL